jgi:hypothetical protein
LAGSNPYRAPQPLSRMRRELIRPDTTDAPATVRVQEDAAFWCTTPVNGGIPHPEKGRRLDSTSAVSGRYAAFASGQPRPSPAALQPPARVCPGPPAKALSSVGSAPPSPARPDPTSKGGRWLPHLPPLWFGRTVICPSIPAPLPPGLVGRLLQGRDKRIPRGRGLPDETRERNPQDTILPSRAGTPTVR